MWVRVFVIGIIISCILQLASTKPFLQNALLSLASSASASASSASSGSPSSSARLTNIVDYTKKEEKMQNVQKEKQLAEDNNVKEDSYENNEASPSLIQKKINKILAKIQFLSSFSGSSDTTSPENDNNTESITETTVSGVKIEFEEVITLKPKTQKIISPSKEYGGPLRINLEVNDVENSTEIEENIEINVDDLSMNRISHIGVFFVELFGSLLGLAYGAVAHINNSIQGSGLPETTI